MIFNKAGLIRILSFACSLGLVLPMLGAVGTAAPSGSEEVPVLVLEAENGTLSGKASVNGKKVGNVGKNGGAEEGKVTFKNLVLPEDGDYLLRVYYMSGSDDRYFDVTTDYGKYRLNCPSTGSFDKTGTIDIKVGLMSGGKLVFGSDWYGPDFDKVEIYLTDQTEFPTREYNDPEIFEWKEIVAVDLANGTFSLINNGKSVLINAHAEAVIGDSVISSDDFTDHDYYEDSDAAVLTVTHSLHPDFKGTMVQTFRLFNGSLITNAVLNSEEYELSTNRISPLTIYKDSISVENGVFVQIPFDNDKWAEPAFISMNNLQSYTTGYEIAALYDNESYSGLVLGSVEHDVWKTGITVSADRGRIMGLSVFGGAADVNTRDTSPHGYVKGNSVSSPAVFVGYFADWREGMREYGRANAAQVAPKTSVESVPFGFNSWGTLQSSVKYSQLIGVSDYIKDNLQDVWGADGTAVYVNIDSYWDFIASNDPSCGKNLDQALRSFVSYCHNNGQKAGIYFTPFTCWHDSEASLKSSNIEGTKYSYYDAALKKSDGSGLYGKLDGGYALDPTHPGTIARYEQQLNYFVRLGFDYVKLDFMTHGALEGDHYDKNVTTGIRAYNFGMEKISRICEGKMFVNLSIAPLFPYQYADGRRISCDAFSSLDNTMHVLSCLTGGFWEDEIYSYPDPDHLVVSGSSDGVARCRVTAGVICGTSFLVGDDLSSVRAGSAGEKRILKMFGNPEVVSVAKLGRAFTPIFIKAGERCADSFFCIENESLYIALFNFDSKKKNSSLDLSEFGVDLDSEVVELWSGNAYSLDGSVLNYSLSGSDAAIYKIKIDQPKQEESIINQEKEVKQWKKPLKIALMIAVGTALLCAAAGAAIAIGKKAKKK